MDLVQILGVVDPGAGLDDIRGKRGVDAVFAQQLASGGSGNFRQVELECSFGQRLERKVRFLVHFEEFPHGAFHQSLVSGYVEQSIFPNDFGGIPPAVASLALGKDKFFAIPNP